MYVYMVGLENECGYCVQREERSVDEGETDGERCPGVKNRCDSWAQLTFTKRAKATECKIRFLMRHGLPWSLMKVIAMRQSASC